LGERIIKIVQASVCDKCLGIYAIVHPLTPASGGKIHPLTPPEKSGQAASGGNINEIIDPNQWV